MLPLSMAALIASSPGQTFGVSIFAEPIRQSLGLSQGQLASAYTLGTLLGAVPLAIFGWAMDRFGLRRALLLAITLFSTACVVTSEAHNWSTLLLGFLLLRMLGPGALSFLSGNTLAFWFDRQLGFVEGIRQLGMAAAMAFVPMLNLWLVGQFGWRGAYAVLGWATWCLLFPVFFCLYRDRPFRTDRADAEELSAQPDRAATLPTPSLTLPEATRTAAFWIVGLGSTAFGVVHTGLFFSLVPVLAERRLTESDAAQLLTCFAVSLACMQLAGGILADRMSPRWLLLVGLAGLTAGVAILKSATSTEGAILAGVILGAAQGIYFGASHPLWARYFGLAHLGKIRGALATVNVAVSSFGPLCAGVMHDMFGSYAAVLAFFACIPVPLAILSMFVFPPRAPADRSVKS